MAKKKVVKKKIVEPRTFLTEVEMLRIDLINEKSKAKEYEVAALRYKQKLQSIEMNTEIARVSEQLQCIKENRKQFNDKIKKELCIDSETWGYNPETGEVQG